MFGHGSLVPEFAGRFGQVLSVSTFRRPAPDELAIVPWACVEKSWSTIVDC